MDGPTILEEIRKYRREIRKIFLSDEEIQKDIKQMITEAFFSVITDLRKSIESLREGLDDLRQEVSVLKERVNKNTQAIEELREQVAKNTQAIQELRQDVAALKDQVAKNTQAVQELREEVSVLKDQVAKNTQAIQELREQVAKNTQAIEELREQVAKNTQAIQELKKDVAALKDQVAKNTQAVQELREEVRENTKSIKELSGYLKEFLHILQEASGIKTEEDLRAFLDAAVYDFGLRVKKHKTKSGRDFDIIITDSKLKPIEIKRTVYDQDVTRFLKAIEELKEEFPDKEFLKPMIVCNVDKIKDPELRRKVEIVEFIDVRRIPISSRRIKKIQEKLQESDLFKER